MNIATTHRARTCLIAAALGLLALGAPTMAQATPTITAFKIEAVPIQGFAGTGDMLGAAAAVEGQLTIAGSEYSGDPLPLTGMKFYAPAGAKLHAQGFATCAPSVIEQSGPMKCPKGSAAGPKGAVTGVVSFGGERVPETASLQPFFAPGGKLEVFLDGTTPTLLEILGAASVISAAPPFGLEFTGEIPLIETVPEAPDASFLHGSIRVGAARRQGNRTISYITLPQRCPKGGWPTKIGLSFLGGGTAEASYEMPCPKGS